MNIVRNWQRIMGVGCTHGEYQNEDAISAILKFKAKFKPKIRIDLGDTYDTKALRTGAKGSQDESSPVDGDLAKGREFIRAYVPTHWCEGNHDARPRLLMSHHNTIISEAAKSVYQRMHEPLREVKAKCRQWNIWEAFEIGGFRWWHGCLYGENYLRDTANRFGNSVVAHAHRAGMAKGVRSDCPTCYGVGTLADIEAMDYASMRTATLAWSHGLIYGEVCDDRAHLQIHEWPKGETEWRLPI
jgi:hypothetical protein